MGTVHFFVMASCLNLKATLRTLQAALILTTMTLSAAHTAASPTPRPDTSAIRAAMQPLDMTDSGVPSYPPAIADYFHFYGLDLPVRHRFDSVQSDSFALATHVFEPESARGTVFVLHGYYDHTGLLSRTIRACVDHGWAVVAFDLPGHGVSSGARASIGDFAEYADAARSVVAACSSRVPRPYVMVGHSTGCAAIVEYLHRNPSSPITGAVLTAPLVRSCLYHVSVAGYWVLKPFSGTWPRWFRQSSSDRDFLTFLHDDPLTDRRFPVLWATANYAWFDRVQSYAPMPTPVTVVQGSDDNVVDWRFNVPFLQRLFPTCSVRMIEGARHHLLNEAPPLRRQAEEAVVQGLDAVTAGTPR